jgi:very-short-patch-repair endonuclease
MKAIARKLRRESTASEQLLWKCLRKNYMLGFSFRRQHIIGPYITDFCCLEKKLVIEIDGSSHDNSIRLTEDAKRQSYLERTGFRVLRFSVNDVEKNLHNVVSVIKDYIRNYPPPYTLPLKGGGDSSFNTT